MKNAGIDFAEMITAFLPLLSVLCTCKIFADRNEEGWQALIPFYSHLVFGRIVNDEKKGRALMIAGFLTLLFGIGFYTVLTFVLSKARPAELWEIALFIFGIAMAVSVTIAFIYGILLKVEFVEKEKGSGWIALVWILFPTIIDIYYAFIKS